MSKKKCFSFLGVLLVILLSSPFSKHAENDDLTTRNLNNCAAEHKKWQNYKVTPAYFF